MGKGHKRGRLEIRELLPGWSVQDGRYLDPDLDTLAPRSNELVDYSVELTVGPHGSDEHDRFTVQIVTPEALAARQPTDDGALADRATLVVSRFDRDGIAAHLESIVARCDTGSLAAAVPLLQQWFRWQFDEFHPRAETPPTLELREITGPGEVPFRSLHPWDDAEVDYALRVDVGRRGEEATHAPLAVRVVTPEALSKLVTDEFCVLADRATLVVAHFEWRDVLGHLETAVSKCEAERFEESAWLLRRYFADA